MKKFFQSKGFIVSALAVLCVAILGVCWFVSRDRTDEFRPDESPPSSTSSDWSDGGAQSDNGSGGADAYAPGQSSSTEEEYPKVTSESEGEVEIDFTDTEKPEETPPPVPEGKTEIEDPGEEHEVNPDPAVPEVTAPPAEESTSGNEPAPGSSNGSGAVYDPVFGWVMKRILIVEDEPDIQELLRAYLEDAGYQTAVAGDGVAALALFGGQPFDLVLLDLMLPKIDGFGVCELIRQQSQIPILMLTALDGEESQLRGFGMDIDDYVTKPFSMPVLLEKIRVILRRRGNTGEDSRLRYRDLTLDLDTREALLDGQLLDLTAREFELLHTFLAAPGRVFTREMLLAKLWGYDFYGDERVVDSHIKNLRHKLGRNYIDTVRGVGYRAAKEDR